jgi:ankyrin repeat protein
MGEQSSATGSAELDKQLWAAAAAGDLELVKQLCTNSADVTYQNDEGTTALMTAAENGHTAVVAALLEAGAPWNQQDTSGYCAGEYATASKNHEIGKNVGNTCLFAAAALFGNGNVPCCWLERHPAVQELEGEQQIIGKMEAASLLLTF